MLQLRNPIVWIIALTMALSCARSGDNGPEAIGSSVAHLVATGSVVNPGNETTNTAQLGSIAGDFSVTPDGAARYVIPIFAPEGPGGLKPKLSLSYNSNAGTSSPGVGVGWSLTGFPLSRITRCSKTYALDATVDPVLWNGNTYCLDGQRLIQLSDNSFRTERDEGIKVVASGTLNAPTKFTVFYPDGLIASLGSSAASRIDGNTVAWKEDGTAPTPANFVTYAWLLDVVNDRAAQLTGGNNNAMIVTYNKLSPTNSRYPSPFAFTEVVPQRIDYSFAAGALNTTNSRRSIRFGYYNGDRGDSRYTFISGLGVASTQAVVSIEVWGPNPTTPAKLLSYALGYERAPTSERDRLLSLTECDQFNLCKPATSFSYEAGSKRFIDIADTGKVAPAWWAHDGLPPDYTDGFPPGPADTSDKAPPVVADVDNDGFDDIVYPMISERHDDGHLFLHYYERPTTWDFGTNPPTFLQNDYVDYGTSYDTTPPGPVILEPVDFWGNGRPSANVTSVTGWSNFWSWVGAPANTVPSLVYPGGIPMGNPLYFADLDGDGLNDLLWVKSLEAPLPDRFTPVPANPAARPAFSRNISLQTMGQSPPTVFGAPIDLKDGSGQFFQTFSGGLHAMQAFVGTFENSSRQSLLIHNVDTPGHAASHLWLFSLKSDGTPVTQNVVSPYVFDPAGPPARFVMMDVNGDGLTDFINASENVPHGDNSAGSFGVNHIWLNTGAGFTPPTFSGHNLVPGAADSGTNYLFNNTVAPIPNGMVTHPPAPAGYLVADFDQDGVQDVVFAGTETGSSRAEMRFLRGARFPWDTTSLIAVDALRTTANTPIPLSARVGEGFPWVQIGDFNGDGLVDIVSRPANDLQHMHFYIHEGKKADQLTGITPGLGTRISIAYDPISNPNVHYGCFITPSAVNNPAHCVHGKKWVVSSYAVDNDVGPLTPVVLDGSVFTRHKDTFTLTYAYGRADIQHGWLGFQARMVKDDRSPLTEVTEYGNLDFKTAFRPTLHALFSTELPMQRQRTQYSYTFTRFLGVAGMGYSLTNMSTEDKYDELASAPPALPLRLRDLSIGSNLGILHDDDLSNKRIRNSRVRLDYDSYGNVVTRRQDHPQGSGLPSETTTYTFNTIDTGIDRWLVSRPTAITTVADDGAGHTTSRQTSCDYYNLTTLVSSCTIEPSTTPAGAPAVTGSDSSVKRVVSYGRGVNGQVTQITETATATSDDPLTGQNLSRITNITYDTTDGTIGGVFPSTISQPTSGTPALVVQHSVGFAYHGGLGVLAQTSDKNGQVTSYTYDGFGRPTGITPPAGGATTISYEVPSDGLLNILRDGAVLAVHTNVTGGRESYEIYNYNGSLIDTKSKLGDGTFSSVITQYTEIPGQVWRISLPTRSASTLRWNTFNYDDLGRIKTKTFADNNTIQFLYSAQPQPYGLQLRRTNERGFNLRYNFDLRGRLVSFTNATDSEPTASDPIVRYSYGPFDVVTQIDAPRLLSTTNGTPRAANTKMYFDVLGRRTWIQDGDIGKRNSSYNAFGELVRETDAAGLATTFTRDSLGRVTKRIDGTGETATYTWDKRVLINPLPNMIGRIALASYNQANGAPGGWTVQNQYQYNTLGQITSEAEHASTVKYTYDSAARLSGITYPGGNISTTYDFDAIGDIKNVYGSWCTTSGCSLPSTPMVTYSTIVDYEDDNQVAREYFGGGTGVTGGALSIYYYHPTRRWMIGVSSAANAGGGFQDWSYGHDEAGNVITRTNSYTGVVEKFTYGTENNLLSWDRGGVGSDGRSSEVGGFVLSSGMSYTPPASRPNFTTTLQPEPSQLAHAISGISNYTFTYDANGNQTASTWLGLSMVHNSLGLPHYLRSTSWPADVMYLYDSEGRRTSKLARASGTGLDVTYRAGVFESRVETDGSNTWVYYIPGRDGRIVAQQTWTQASGGPLVQQRILYFQRDKMGSVSSITSTAGVDAQYSYSPYGVRTPANDTAHGVAPFRFPGAPSPTVTLGFTGHEHEDSQAQALINMRGRMYDNSLGRFFSPDPYVTAPLSMAGYDRYAYVMNNPFKYTDSTGFTGTYIDEGTVVFDDDPISSMPPYGLDTISGSTKKLYDTSAPIGTPDSLSTQVGGVDNLFTFDDAHPFPAPGTPHAFVDLTHYGSGLPPVYSNGGTFPNPETAKFERGIVELTPLGDVKKLLEPNATTGEKIWAGVKLAGTLVPFWRAAAAAEGLISAERALTAVDLGLSGKGILNLTGSLLDSGTTRIINVENITATTGTLVSELRGAMPKILDAARAAGVRTLQVTGRFANEGLKEFAAGQATKYGGTFSSVGGQEALTFILEP